MKKNKSTFALLKEAFAEWNADKAPRLGAALAYYTIFSIAPLILIAIAIAGAVFGDEAARGQMFGQLKQLFGEGGAKALQDMIENADKNKSGGVIASIIGVVTLLFGATGVFVQLKDALNTVWNVEEQKGGGIGAFIKTRILSFGMVLGIGFLLLVSLVLTVAVSASGKFMEGVLPGGELLWQIVTFALELGVVTVLFAVLFKYLPDVKLEWRDVWVGAAFTSVLFVLGKFGLGLYLGKGTVGSAYGAAGALVVLLLWIYYSAQIMFFGAEFTQVLVKNRSKDSPAAARASLKGAKPEEKDTKSWPEDAHARTVLNETQAGGGHGCLIGAGSGCLGLFAGIIIALASIVKVIVGRVKKFL
ncbi:MAG TPA: YihY/virulence factor BrkB family protein [Thermoanaerobaculia bacterium]|nr:YihY/virulence factor BrkB family protein [Thermoanaerobaculia bacterium]